MCTHQHHQQQQHGSRRRPSSSSYASLVPLALLVGLVPCALASTCPRAQEENVAMIYPDILEETGKVVDLVWSGEEANIVFALTESTTNQLGGRLWRSKSRGEHRTWAE